jgi:hypothetical protein
MPIAVAPPASQIRRTRPIGARCAASEVKSGVGSKHRNQDRERNQAVVVITDHRFSRHRSSLRTPFRIRRHLARVHRQVMSQETRPTKAEVRATISVVGDCHEERDISLRDERVVACNDQLGRRQRKRMRIV